MSLARVSALLAIVAIAGCGSDDAVRKPVETSATDRTPATVRTAPLVPGGDGHLAVMARGEGLTLRDKPNGKVIAHLRSKTRWGSPTVAWAVDRRGDWLGVVATALENNQVGWVDARKDRPRMWRSRYALRIDLSGRRLELRRGGRVLRRIAVGIGGPSSPTPTGRFAVTDKLIPNRGSVYGCCILALSGHQPNLRPGWAGGDRIAIHGGSVGTAASAGCVHASDAELRRLLKLLPVGTPVVIRG